jgi:hypothetical protein
MNEWRALLSIATRQLASIGVPQSEWVWGGGTVLMLRHQHRLSRDIDIFLADPQYLTMLSPRLNDAVAADVSTYQEASNHLRLVVHDKGELDYLVVAPVFRVAPEPMDIEIHGSVSTMPDGEILAQKLYYRASGFTGRDLFDFATVTRKRPELLDDVDLRKVALARRAALIARIESDTMLSAYKSIEMHPQNKTPVNFDEARSGLLRWLG